MMKYFALFLIIFQNINILKSQDNDTLNSMFKNSFYKDMSDILSKPNIDVLKNTSFDDFKRWKISSLDIDGVERVKLNKKLNKYFKKLRNIDTCTKYFDTCLCNRGSWIVDEFKQLIERGFHCYLNNSVYDFKKDIDELINELKESDSIKVFNATADTIDGRYIPKNLDDAFQQLDTILDSNNQKSFIIEDEESAVSGEHFGLGMGLRNSWCLWGSSRLQRYIYSEYGIKQPDSQSSFILTLYHRRLRGDDLDIDQLKKIIQEQESQQEEEVRLREESE